MSTINNTQNAQNNSKGTAQAKARKVNVIEIDLTNSSNKVEDFCSRVKSSANNIDRFPDAEILICYEKTAPRNGERNIIQKFCLEQDSEANVYLIEGDKRKRDSHLELVDIGLIKGNKSDWLLENAKNIIIGMCIFDERYGHPERKYSEALGVTREEVKEFYKVVFPQRAKEIELDEAINNATAEVMELIKGTMVEGMMVDDYRVVRVNNWGVTIEYENGSMESHPWTDTVFFLPFQRELNKVLRDYSAKGKAKVNAFTDYDNDVTISLVKSKTPDKVILRTGEMSKSFNDGNYAQMYLWVYENRHEIGKPKYEIQSYLGLYGTDKVEDVVTIAKDVLQVNYEFLRDDRTYKVVYRNELGVTFTETSTEIINGTQFNNNRLVSFNWEDFKGWKNMPPEDMCSVDLKWLVQDGKATLIDETSDVYAYSKVA